MAEKVSKQEHFDTSLKVKEIRAMPVKEMEMLMERTMRPYVHEAHVCFGFLCGIGMFYNSLRDDMNKICKVTSEGSHKRLLTILQEQADSLSDLAFTYDRLTTLTKPSNRHLAAIRKDFLKALRECAEGCKYGVEFLTEPTQTKVRKLQLYKKTLESVADRMNKIYKKAEHLRQVHQKALGSQRFI